MALTRARSLAAPALAAAAMLWSSSDRAIACDPWPATLVLVPSVRPADPDAFARGSLGVVLPTYGRQYLVQAYRRMIGRAPAGRDVSPQVNGVPLESAAVEAWLRARDRITKETSAPAYQFKTWRLIGQQAFDNCPAEAFTTAARTLEARARAFGPTHPSVLDWVHAQNDVFRNCNGESSAIVPAPADPTAPNALKTDRAYQTASAYFYAADYERAESLFRAIATDRTSPWQPFGTYLAARAVLRRASLATTDSARALAVAAQADRMFAAIADDRTSPMAVLAGQLRHLIAARFHPVDRLHDTAATLASSPEAAGQDLTDYTRMVDRLVSPDVVYSYNTIPNRAALIAGDDLTDWILALQGTGNAAAARAMGQWTSTRSLPWLVAALWRTGAADPRAGMLLEAAAELAPESPAYATVAFLRVRLLMARNEPVAARDVLSTLPDAPGARWPAEAINLVRAQRLQIASTLDEALRVAPRWPVAVTSPLDGLSQLRPASVAPTFDIDAATFFSEGLPLGRLVDAARSDVLPPRLRAFVAVAAWTRAVQLRDDAAGRPAATALSTLVPVLAPDLDRYLAAADAEARHRVGILTLLRWPSLRNYVRLTEDLDSHAGRWPSPDLETDTNQNWWCGFGPNRHFRHPGPYEERPLSRLRSLLGAPARPAPPAFLSAMERSTLASERARLAALGTAPNYLADEAVTWARARPTDLDAAEALARAVQAGRWGCTDDRSGRFSRRAFAALHALFPNTTWAKQTKFWYDGR